MKQHMWTRWLFYVAFVYEAVLGVAFLAFGERVFAWYGVPPPNHPGYIQFPAALLILFGLLYLAVARDPVANRSLIPYGAGLKVCYCAVVFGHDITGDLPSMWIPFAWCDLAFLLLFVFAYMQLNRSASLRA
jgi:hypothetical protein